MDFWRMVVEHNVATMVMLAGGESSGWQYWPSDDGERTLTFGCMTVTLVSRESRVSYVKREFKVYNTKVKPSKTIELSFYCLHPCECFDGIDLSLPDRLGRR